MGDKRVVTLALFSIIGYRALGSRLGTDGRLGPGTWRLPTRSSAR